MTELKPCPFCGGEATLVEGLYNDRLFSYVSCDNNNCNAKTGRCDTNDEAITRWNKRPNPWHTGTPTENGYYLCKVFYDKDTSNDMRILEWVGSLDCFCIPYSEFRAYHYYVGENNGEDVEVVYEWQKLDMRFRMETKWVEPYKEGNNEGNVMPADERQG